MTQRARRRHRRSRRSARNKILLGVGVFATLVALLIASVAAWVLSVAASAPSIGELQPIDKGETSVVYAADGSRLGFIQSDDIRQPVPLDRMPQRLQDATVAIEDENFYEHSGIDLGAIVRAAVKNLEAGEAIQGGSTITQQLVRNLYISDPEDTLERKIREAKLAEELEDEHSKEWILEQYLNTASYGTIDGRTAVGVEAAAQMYFSKPASELDLPESALLAGLPQAPSAYNPLQNPDGALGRRNEVLQAMEEQGYISHRQYEQALQADLGLARGYLYTTIREPYFFSYVEQELIERYGVNTVRKGGLEVYTTINPRLQAAANASIANHDYGGPARALVSTDVSNGHILAMASSQQFADSQFNLAAQGLRQPGSAFKTFVLTAGIEQGMDPASTYYDSSSPKTLKLPFGQTWTVNNSEGTGSGTTSVANATTHSINVVFAQLDLDVGPENVTETARNMGITAPLNDYPAEGIGGLEQGVSPLEMSNAYATLAAGGVHRPPTAISRVEFPSGEVDVAEEGEQRRAFSDGVAYEVTDVLKSVVTSGTGTAANYGCPIAGKTGTTEENSDAWFAGYSPEISTAVWVGYPNARISLGSSGFGGTLAAPIWHDYMVVAAGDSCEDFPRPENPADLSAFYGKHTVSYDPSPIYVPDGTAKPGDTDRKRYQEDYYAPSPDEEPAPSPDSGDDQTSPGNGNGKGQGGGTGGAG
jgi:penicillin-binding protein 1A